MLNFSYNVSLADIAYRHCGPSPIIVTACMDRMRLFSELKVENELQLEGAVIHVGRSSLRVSVSVSEVSNSNPPIHLASSTFLMVARARDQNVAQPVPSLMPVSDGKEAHDAAKPGKKDQLRSTTWSPEEISLLHHLHSERGSNPDKFIWPQEARDDKTLLMHSQNRNVHGRMFGGYLMASAYELAWLIAYKLAKRHPSPTFIDDVEFIRPVDIGSILSFEAQVAYTYRKHAIIDVHARVINPLTGESTVTNTFHFGFDIGDDCKQIVPDTYNQMKDFIDGMRRCRSFQDEPRQ